MITLRKSQERGHANHGWLNTYHTFSFANYYDPSYMGFRDLRVINEDQVHPGRGFGMHPHRDMEIITYILKGALEHQDSMGNGSVIQPGDVQRMSAGTGILHSEYNPSKTESVHLLQIWILPNQTGITPSYEQKHFSAAEKHNQLRLIASPTGEDGSVTIHQDVNLYATVLDAGKTVHHSLKSNRHAWIQVAKGEVTVNDVSLHAGDGMAVSEAQQIVIQGNQPAEFLLFDLA